jgi:hypothetical protein
MQLRFLRTFHTYSDLETQLREPSAEEISRCAEKTGRQPHALE